MTVERPDPLIRLRGVRRTYPLARLRGRSSRVVALDCEALIVRAGERLGIIGRNGAGKSTLLRILAGLEAPNQGKLEVTGQVTAVLTLGLGLREDLSGRENIWVDGRLRGLEDRAIEASLQSIVDFAGLGDFIDRPVRTYSTGMKARLGFAMISQLQPEILLIDEALSVGDAEFSRKATAQIRAVCERGRIVIVVSHSMQAIRDICSRCIWLDGGRLVMDGDPETVTRAYEEAVRAADERALRERFSALEGSRSCQVGWEILGLELRQPDRGDPARIVASGSAVEVRLQVVRPEGEAAELELRITRLDGIIAFHRVELISADAGAPRLVFVFEPLTLWIGSYRIEAALRPAGSRAHEPLASSSYVFEVFADRPFPGGRPLIRPEFRGSSRIVERSERE